MERIVVLTGAGMSADSGLKTFRDSGGLWEGYEIQEVATPEGWKNNPEKVLDFYNKRRKQAYQAKPNKGHKALVKLEEQYKVTIITQNVDNLHERAGSGNVLHLHGNLHKARSEKNEELIYEVGRDPIRLGDKAEDGAQLRPHVVWFGEMVPNLQRAAEIVSRADILIVIGTSLAVYPAAGLIDYAPSSIPKFLVDPNKPELYDERGWNFIKKRAEDGVPSLVQDLLNNH